MKTIEQDILKIPEEIIDGLKCPKEIELNRLRGGNEL
jgi:hypothetical protein